VKPTEPGAGGVAQAGQDRPGRHRVGPDGRLQPAGLAALPGGDGVDSLFTRSAADYAAGHAGQQVALLLAGAATAGGAVDLARLRAAGCDLVVSLIDTDDDTVRAAVAAAAGQLTATLGDLRTVPLAPRSVDIAVCCLLLERIRNAELVLDRIVDAVKPGGLLLLAVTDRDSAAGLLDRKLPAWARALAWRRLRPGQPGPYPAVYEQLASGRGIQAYTLRRGLVIAQRQDRAALAGQRGRAPLWLLAARRLAAVASRPALSPGRDELRFVIRKPEDRFARVL
jgi:SAM-dependent methyltransferase